MNEKLNADKERLKADLSDTVQDVKEHVAAKAGQVKEQDRKSTRLNSSHLRSSRMPSSA